MPRWRRDSIFGDGPRQPLDRNGRARFSFLLDAHHRAGRLTRAARDVGRALLKRLGVDGQCDPSHATLADDAECCERTVERACGAMRAIGLLFWQRRLMRDGSRVDQISNAYVYSTAVESEARKRAYYAAFVEQAATMLPEETIAAIWRKVEAATRKEAEASGVA